MLFGEKIENKLSELELTDFDSLELEKIKELREELMTDYQIMTEVWKRLAELLSNITQREWEKDDRFTKVVCENCGGEGYVPDEDKEPMTFLGQDKSAASLKKCDVCDTKGWRWAELYKKEND